MSEELQQKLRDQLWEVANRLRGNMSASDFMYFTLGFIFYKYLSEKIENYANGELVDDEVTFKELWAMTDEDATELQEEVKNQCLTNIGYFVEPKYLFSSIIECIKKKENILPLLERSLKRIEDSTLGRDSEEDFGGLFSDIDLASPKLGKTADDKNTLVGNVLLALDEIDFGVEASQEIVVKTVHALRNRVAHHEPLVNGIPLPGENRRITLADAMQACFDLAMILDRDLYAWLMDNSKMKLVLEHEPRFIE